MVPPEQAPPSPATSSVMPLQSSSMPLQVSACFCVAPVQVLTPALQVYVPVLHCTEPPLFWQSARLPVGQQLVPAHGSVRWLSTVPSQSSSAPLQVSATGTIWPEQEAKLADDGQVVALQVCVPV